ncbi:hypothetical protein FG386_002325 [Cryptosporidium ryanae]|uniref:uncharacterized protein n=1 Tax=Cryptosporidium ryanae TaxID=515981 RepID=UPI00351A60B0|nr:hypothetical protein FG386_002325 [Cryptosporidium ryanae]
MENITDSNITSFKLNKLPQFPKSIKLDLSSNVGDSESTNENKEARSEKEEGDEIIKLLLNNSIVDDDNNKNTDNCIVENNKIIFQLGSSIVKRKTVEATSNNKNELVRVNEKNLNNDEIPNFEFLDNSVRVENIYRLIGKIEEENENLRVKIRKDVEKMTSELKSYKESLVDYWIELTLTQVKNQNHNQDDNSSDNDTLVSK